MANKVENPQMAPRMPAPANGQQHQIAVPKQPPVLGLLSTPESLLQTVNVIEAGTTQIVERMEPFCGGEGFAGTLTVRNIFRVTLED